MDNVASLTGVPNTELVSKVSKLENENATLKKAMDDLRNLVISLQARVDSLESKDNGSIAAKSEAPKVKLNIVIVYYILNLFHNDVNYTINLLK